MNNIDKYTIIISKYQICLIITMNMNMIHIYGINNIRSNIIEL